MSSASLFVFRWRPEDGIHQADAVDTLGAYAVPRWLHQKTAYPRTTRVRVAGSAEREFAPKAARDRELASRGRTLRFHAAALS